jgi:hypothetical protein
MDWLILHRDGSEFSLPLRYVDRVVPWSPAMTWAGRGQPEGLIFGDVPPMVVSEPSTAVSEPPTAVSEPPMAVQDSAARDPVPASQEPRFVVLRDRRHGDCGVAFVADRVDLAMQSRGAPISIPPSRDIHR